MIMSNIIKLYLRILINIIPMIYLLFDFEVQRVKHKEKGCQSLYR